MSNRLKSSLAYVQSDQRQHATGFWRLGSSQTLAWPNLPRPFGNVLLAQASKLRQLLNRNQFSHIAMSVAMTRALAAVVKNTRNVVFSEPVPPPAKCSATLRPASTMRLDTKRATHVAAAINRVWG